MKVNIILFGQLTDITGADTVTLENILDTDNLVSTLHKSYPAFIHSKYVIAVDKKVISENTPLLNNCTVALLPPFSGG
ncbi:MAG: MoaD/ThiS family protein [Ferruginibacter sp.]|nr:MoaD/ThiS family protein [Ferruginibacter sp.]